MHIIADMVDGGTVAMPGSGFITGVDLIVCDGPLATVCGVFIAGGVSVQSGGINRPSAPQTGVQAPNMLAYLSLHAVQGQYRFNPLKIPVKSGDKLVMFIGAETVELVVYWTPKTA